MAPRRELPVAVGRNAIQVNIRPAADGARHRYVYMQRPRGCAPGHRLLSAHRRLLRRRAAIACGIAAGHLLHARLASPLSPSATTPASAQCGVSAPYGPLGSLGESLCQTGLT